MVKSTCLRHTVASVSTNMSDRHVIDLRWSATGDGRKRRDPTPATRPRQRVKNTHRTQQHNATTQDTTPNYEEQL